MSELLPCPWCTRVPVHGSARVDHLGEWYVECADSNCLIGINRDTREELFRDWNAVAALPARIAALEAENAELVAALKVAAEALDLAVPSPGSPLHAILVSAHAQAEAVLAAAGGEGVQP